MASFSYSAKDTKGELIQSTMEAESQAVVINRLQAMGYFPIGVKGVEAERK